MKKYELTDETMESGGRTLHRIKALVTIPGVVMAGDLGGWVESEENLSQEGDCWVRDNAEVCHNAKVHGNAKIYGNAKVFGNARVYSNAVVFGNAEVYGNARVRGSAKVYGNAEVCCDAEVYGNARVYESAEVCHNSKVYDNADVFENASVCDDACVYGNARVYGNAEVCRDAEVYQYARVCGYTRVFDGHITSRYDCITVGPIGSRGNFTTFNKTTGTICTGCFKGTLAEFEKAVEKTHGDNEHGRAYNDLIAYFKTLVANPSSSSEPSSEPCKKDNSSPVYVVSTRVVYEMYDCDEWVHVPDSDDETNIVNAYTSKPSGDVLANIAVMEENSIIKFWNKEGHDTNNAHIEITSDTSCFRQSLVTCNNVRALVSVELTKTELKS